MWNLVGKVVLTIMIVATECVKEIRKQKREEAKSHRKEETFTCEFCKKACQLTSKRFLSCNHGFCIDCLEAHVLFELILNPEEKEVECPLKACNIKTKPEGYASILEDARQKKE